MSTTTIERADVRAQATPERSQQPPPTDEAKPNEGTPEDAVASDAGNGPTSDVVARRQRKLYGRLNEFTGGDVRRLEAVAFELITEAGDSMGAEGLAEAIVASGEGHCIMADALHTECDGNIDDLFEQAEKRLDDDSDAPDVDPDEPDDAESVAVDETDDEADDDGTDAGESALVAALLDLGAGAAVARCVKQLIRVDDEPFLDALAERLKGRADGKPTTDERNDTTANRLSRRVEDLLHHTYRELDRIRDVHSAIDGMCEKRDNRHEAMPPDEIDSLVFLAKAVERDLSELSDLVRATLRKDFGTGKGAEKAAQRRNAENESTPAETVTADRDDPYVRLRRRYRGLAIEFVADDHERLKALARESVDYAVTDGWGEALADAILDGNDLLGLVVNSWACYDLETVERIILAAGESLDPEPEKEPTKPTNVETESPASPSPGGRVPTIQVPIKHHSEAVKRVQDKLQAFREEAHRLSAVAAAANNIDAGGRDSAIYADADIEHIRREDVSAGELLSMLEGRLKAFASGLEVFEHDVYHAFAEPETDGGSDGH